MGPHEVLLPSGEALDAPDHGILLRGILVVTYGRPELGGVDILS